MYYKIGTLAKRFGVTPQALRFYERHGLLLPARESEGGDRRYQSRNLKWLYSIRRYHDLGYSLEETLELFSCESVQELDVMAAAKERETRAELELLESRLGALRRQREELERIGQLFHRCEMADMPRLWLVMDQKGQNVDQTPAPQKEVQEWMHFLPWVYAAVAIEGERLVPDSPYEEARECGYCIEEPVAGTLGVPRGLHTRVMGGGRAIHTVTALDRPGITVGELLGYALDYARDKGLTVTSAVGRCLAKTGEIRCREDLLPQMVHFEYWLAVEG